MTDIQQLQDRITNITQQITDMHLTSSNCTEKEQLQWTAVIKELEKHKIYLAHRETKNGARKEEGKLNITNIYPSLVYASTPILYATFEHMYVFKKS